MLNPFRLPVKFRLDGTIRAIFGRTYAAERDLLVDQLREDEAIAEVDTRRRW
jgi:hypothetical protein